MCWNAGDSFKVYWIVIYDSFFSFFPSYSCTSLVLLALASQRIETEIFKFGDVNAAQATKRGAPPTLIELMVLPWVLGLYIPNYINFLLHPSFLFFGMFKTVTIDRERYMT